MKVSAKSSSTRHTLLIKTFQKTKTWEAGATELKTATASWGQGVNKNTYPQKTLLHCSKALRQEKSFWMLC